MSKLVWGESANRFYETGVDRGVLYPTTGAEPRGVAWNGLVNIKEKPTGGKAKGLYYDGFKYLNYAALEEFEFSIEAFTYPYEFLTCDGVSVDEFGMEYSSQTRTEFGLSYRTYVGNAVDGTTGHYKIHLVYNAMVKPAGRQNDSLSESPSLMTFNWDAVTRPEIITGVQPASHLIIDSFLTHPNTLVDIEDKLYGTTDLVASLPTPNEIKDMFTVMIAGYGHGPYGHGPYGHG